ncbi:uncharacterized protein LOC120089086 [Benincasa hispida]|uniref:uncharacterized protein LOC120089086 n=1 Tax=Benincasa hispida TaxID=102211 RepID=UPI001901C641|nr:uncharacterized protein LOC120089086 [Benincasa hispida]
MTVLTIPINHHHFPQELQQLQKDSLQLSQDTKAYQQETRANDILHDENDDANTLIAPLQGTKLKALPSYLKYMYLGERNTLLVIISRELTPTKEESLIDILKTYKEAIGWTLDNLKGISPTLCMHRITLEEDAKSMVQPLKRLNPNLKDIVLKEIIKLKEVVIIYPILDNKWVSLIHIVPEKTDMTIVENDKGEMVPMRTYAIWALQCSRYVPKVYDEYFSDFIEMCIEVFIDDFTVYGESFEDFLHNLSLVLKRCIEANLVLNYEKCHFMASHGIVLGHLVSVKELEVDKAKVDVIANLPYSTCVRETHSFLGSAGFHRRFIKDFSKLALPLSTLLQKDVPFEFDKKFQEAFDTLKEKLTTTLILQPPRWDMSFEIMCDASNLHVRAVLGQRVNKKSHVICFALRTLKPNQINYTAAAKEFVVIGFALDKFHSYILGFLVTIFTNHAALRYLMIKKESKSRFFRWMLLLQELNLTIKDRNGAENLVADHLSKFPDDISSSRRAKLKSDSKYFIWEPPYLWKFCSDQIIRRFGIPRAIISDQGTHCCDQTIEALMRKYGVHNRVATPYHPQTNGQAKISN